MHSVQGKSAPADDFIVLKSIMFLESVFVHL